MKRRATIKSTSTKNPKEKRHSKNKSLERGGQEIKLINSATKSTTATKIAALKKETFVAEPLRLIFVTRVKQRVSTKKGRKIE